MITKAPDVAQLPDPPRIQVPSMLSSLLPGQVNEELLKEIWKDVERTFPASWRRDV